MQYQGVADGIEHIALLDRRTPGGAAFGKEAQPLVLHAQPDHRLKRQCAFFISHRSGNLAGPIADAAGMTVFAQRPGQRNFETNIFQRLFGRDAHFIPAHAVIFDPAGIFDLVSRGLSRGGEFGPVIGDCSGLELSFAHGFAGNLKGDGRSQQRRPGAGDLRREQRMIPGVNPIPHRTGHALSGGLRLQRRERRNNPVVENDLFPLSDARILKVPGIQHRPVGRIKQLKHVIPGGIGANERNFDAAAGNGLPIPNLAVGAGQPEFGNEFAAEFVFEHRRFKSDQQLFLKK
ncbi:hypothetical protein SDC9_111097 [bioreactor metagenome]|uniref:Uncharacterized protein n=1 Tax=bioreactor metagenome TaxID=1076179 RepID=A0A645BI20_9ZZZZ